MTKRETSQPVAVRMPQSFIQRAKDLTDDCEHLPEFMVLGSVSSQAVYRRALQIGLAELEKAVAKQQKKGSAK